MLPQPRSPHQEPGTPGPPHQQVLPDSHFHGSAPAVPAVNVAPASNEPEIAAAATPATTRFTLIHRGYVGGLSRFTPTTPRLPPAPFDHPYVRRRRATWDSNIPGIHSMFLQAMEIRLVLGAPCGVSAAVPETSLVTHQRPVRAMGVCARSGSASAGE